MHMTRFVLLLAAGLRGSFAVPQSHLQEINRSTYNSHQNITNGISAAVPDVLMFSLSLYGRSPAIERASSLNRIPIPYLQNSKL